VTASVHWLGHACVEIEIAGVTVLTDPALTPRLAHLRRHHQVDRSTIAAPDLILISHVHLDHLHPPSLRMFDRGVQVIAPAGAGRLLRRHGFGNVIETRAGDTTEFGPLTIETVQAVHPSGRGPHTRLRADAVGYVLRADDAAIYFPGDTALFPEMGTWEPIDVALLPIGGWGETVGDGHLDPTTAVEAAGLIAPRLVVPVHWGTYSPIGLRRPSWLDAPGERFQGEMEGAGVGHLLRLLPPGGSLVLPPEPSLDIEH
jgi:L-ascorbate metabolism protein UlaG (beta-lactamase superfamily)